MAQPLNFSSSTATLAGTLAEWGGCAISKYGNVLAQGYLGNGSDAGTVQVYDLVNGNFVQRGADIVGPVNEDFGREVRISDDGNTVAVSAPYYGTSIGSIAVYQWDGSAWSQLGSTILGSTTDNYLGSNLSFDLSGDGLTLCYIDRKTTTYGKLFTRLWNGSSWASGVSDIVGTVSYIMNIFDGVSLSSDGTALAYGQFYNTATQVFDLVSTTWTQRGLDISDGSNEYISLSGDGSVVGYADGDDEVFVFYKWNGSSWTQYGTDYTPTAFPNRISLDETGSKAFLASALYDAVLDVELFVVEKAVYSNTDWEISGEALSLPGLYGYIPISGSKDGSTLAISAIDTVDGVYGQTRVYSKQSPWVQVGEKVTFAPQVNFDGTIDVGMSGTIATPSTFVGTLTPLLYVTADVSVFKSSSSSYLYVPVNLYGLASAVKFTAEGNILQDPNLSADVVALKFSSFGELYQTLGQELSPTADPDFPTIDGDIYVVVNLHTKSHTTYRDGNNIQAVRSGELTFASQALKNVSDAYLHGRSNGEVDLVVNNGEETERTYPVVFGSTTGSGLKNKKVKLSKGLRGTNWQFSVVVPDGEKLYLQGMDLLVSDLKRRV